MYSEESKRQNSKKETMDKSFSNDGWIHGLENQLFLDFYNGQFFVSSYAKHRLALHLKTNYFDFYNYTFIFDLLY